MSKKSRKRNKRILAVLGLAAAATAASRRNKADLAGTEDGKNAKADRGINMADIANTPVAPIGPRAVNVATPPKRSNASIAGDFISKINDKKSAESGMQFSNSLVNSRLKPRIRTPIQADNSGIIKQYKSGGRTGYSAGGAAKRGVSPILLKGKR